MKNRSLFIAAVAAAMAAPQVGVAPSAEPIARPTQAQPQGGMHTPQGGIGTLLQALMGGRGFGGATGWRQRYIGRGYSVAHGRRMATKRRNRLRAKGQFRKAVR